tara:strand:- start:241 stop:393 length:153 start_codon:yes stop_codon:yes gene_type:complete
MNGNISNNVIGEFNIVKKYGYQKGTLISFKNVISSKIFKISVNAKNIKEK